MIISQMGVICCSHHQFHLAFIKKWMMGTLGIAGNLLSKSPILPFYIG